MTPKAPQKQNKKNEEDAIYYATTGEAVKPKTPTKHIIESVKKIEIDLEKNKITIFAEKARVSACIKKVKKTDVTFSDYFVSPFAKKERDGIVFSATKDCHLSDMTETELKACTDESVRFAIQLLNKHVRLIKYIEKNFKN